MNGLRVAPKAKKMSIALCHTEPTKVQVRCRLRRLLGHDAPSRQAMAALLPGRDDAGSGAGAPFPLCPTVESTQRALRATWWRSCANSLMRHRLAMAAFLTWSGRR